MEDTKPRTPPPSSRDRTCVQHLCQKRLSASWKDASTACVAFVVFGVCVLLYLRTSDLQSRVLSLEKDRNPRINSWISSEQVEPLLWSRLDQMLEERRAIEHFVGDLMAPPSEQPSRNAHTALWWFST
ncbi:hypothetical protein DNTS_024062 [Danionella cerebrum]|uniref:Uncharacterized protein n=1 Tax=Danionella cerebrum TaxID=2873325 RepID=A0A553NJF6_9TELE|nr:hypothetical protein DNTS_024062 [Danionella translucida]